MECVRLSLPRSCVLSLHVYMYLVNKANIIQCYIIIWSDHGHGSAQFESIHTRLDCNHFTNIAN